MTVIINEHYREVKLNGREIRLSRREYDLLKMLIDEDRIVTRDFVFKKFGGIKPSGRAIDTYICRLRRKGFTGIQTVSGFGYCWKIK